MSIESPDVPSEPGAPAKGTTARTLEDALLPLPFHLKTVEHLKETEREHWAWFSSTSFLDKYGEDVRLELLKSCYRFERAEHQALYDVVAEVSASLGIKAPVTVYQSQGAQTLNAYLAYVPGEAHVVLEGPLQGILTSEELRSTLAHELTHYLLWEREGGELLVADQMLSAMANHPRAVSSHIETARLFRLYTEVHADRGTLAVRPDPLPAISALIKVQTGLAEVSAESYLRQSDEIFSKEDVKAEELTHPEAFIRARALSLWAAQGQAADPEIARMIEGSLDASRLTLLGQNALSDTTRRVLACFLRPKWLQTQARLAHARLFFPDLDPEAEGDDPARLRDDLGRVRESVHEYLSYVLLDLSTVDRQGDDAALAAGLKMADALGFAETFLKIAGDELDLSKRARARLKKEAGELVPESVPAPRDEP